MLLGGVVRSRKVVEDRTLRNMLVARVWKAQVHWVA